MNPLLNPLLVFKQATEIHFQYNTVPVPHLLGVYCQEHPICSSSKIKQLTINVDGVALDSEGVVAVTVVSPGFVEQLLVSSPSISMFGMSKYRSRKVRIKFRLVSFGM